MNKNNNLEIEFNKNVALTINKKIKELKFYINVLKEIKHNPNLKLTDDYILSEIYFLFGDDCISDRTFRNIKNTKYSYTSSSGFNICIIIYTLNSLVDEINLELDKFNSNYNRISKISLNSLLVPLES